MLSVNQRLAGSPLVARIQSVVGRIGTLPADDSCDFQASDTRVVMLDEDAVAETCEGLRKKAAALSRAGISFAVLPNTPEYLSESGSALLGELAVHGISTVLCDSEDAVARFLHCLMPALAVRNPALPGPAAFAEGATNALKRVPGVGDKTARAAVQAGGRGVAGVCRWVARDTEMGLFLHTPLEW